MRKYLRFISIIFVALTHVTASAGDGLLSEQELLRRIQVFGDDFLVAVLKGPTLENPAEWIMRRAGDYRYRYVSGSDYGALEQTESHVPDADRPNTVWQRRVGDNLIETFVRDTSRDILIVEEADLQRGFRVEIEPGVHVPAKIAPGDELALRSTVTVFELDDGEMFDKGTLESIITYEGAFRVRTPAGEFDTVLIREDFLLDVGPLSATDDRFLFFARDVGLVAEIEGVKASAMFLIRTSDKSAKVLVSYPDPNAPGGTAGDISAVN